VGTQFQARFAEAAEIEKNDVKEPLMAVIGRMRNDIIHHHGVAPAKNSGRCELLKWFQPGDTILITGKEVADFMQHVGAITVFSGKTVQGSRYPALRTGTTRTAPLRTSSGTLPADTT
jgi:hypothetical protein